MKVLVTGATGFIGKQVVQFLQGLGRCHVLTSARNEERLKQLGADYIVYDLNEEPNHCYERLGRPEVLIHLAWEGLPHYQESFHLDWNLINNYRFLRSMVEQGLPSLTVTGTCYEYGLQNGCLQEEMLTNPTTSYGIAKDVLRRRLAALQEKHPFRLRWLRLFFMYGPGQPDRTLMAQVDQALAAGRETFDMSGGEQLRDYLPAAEVAALIAKVALQTRHDGIFNICSGQPISVRRLVEEHIAAKRGRLRLNLGVYPYPAHEPMAFWGDPARMRFAVTSFEEEQKETAPPLKAVI
jgi:dTDP-6-deoxy-L-talose 4-dehydrogenase (NAD+)